MTEEEILYQMACDFGHEAYSELGEIDYKLYENIEGKDIAKYFAEKLAARDVEMQKQIEAVRGLIAVYEEMGTFIQYKIPAGENAIFLTVQNNSLRDSLSTLTETLKPHLNGEKLEV
jgi:hypothetical protein